MKNLTNSLIKRGAIFYADLSPIIGSEQGGTRPVIIVSNDKGNSTSTTIIVACITSHAKRLMSVHCPINKYPLHKQSVVMLEQLRTIDKSRLLMYIGIISKKEMKLIDKKLSISLSIGIITNKNEKERNFKNEKYRTEFINEF